MNSTLAFLLSIGIWFGEFYVFAIYVNTQSELWMGITMFFMLVSMLLMWLALGTIERKDFRKAKVSPSQRTGVKE